MNLFHWFFSFKITFRLEEKRIKNLVFHINGLYSLVVFNY